MADGNLTPVVALVGAPRDRRLAHEEASEESRQCEQLRETVIHIRDWPFEMVDMARFDGLTDRQKGQVEGAMIFELRRIEDRRRASRPRDHLRLVHRAGVERGGLTCPNR